MCWVKKEFPKYDVIISNVLTVPNIDLVHPELVKEFHSQEANYIYPKNNSSLVH